MIKYLIENFESLRITLTSDEIAMVRSTIQAVNLVEGPRYPPGHTEVLFTDTVDLDV